jgi:hypothetical protein
MAWPSKIIELLKKYNLAIKWKSNTGVHHIHKDDYDQME